ncbi:MAG TPA: Zn-dependent alcohol dehydrogenase [Candidatus Acidoferrales bacterium]|nr:Zn-dependent alcohol dehydrogenase [Candidatus Acidoferrales bacterium]
MKAALLDTPGQPLRVGEITIDAPRAGQVRVRVTHCGVCHSDLSIVNGTFPSPLPIVLGHEAAGIVDAIGPNVDGLQVGDHVVLTPCPPCGTCYWCVRGEPTVCVNAAAIQTNTFPDGSTGLARDGQVVYRGVGVGAFAQYVVASATGAVKIPADVPLELACVIGCAVQTGVGAVLNTAKVEEGATVLVMGLGGVGLSVVQGARLAGAARIIVSDPVAERRALAASFGATDTIDPSAEDVVARVHEITTVGADYAFDTAGHTSLIQTGLAATRAGGMTVCVGAPPMDDVLTIAMPALFVVTEKKLRGCALGSSNSLREIPRLVSLWQAGRLDLEGLVTARRPLAQINEAMADLTASRGIRTVLELA